MSKHPNFLLTKTCAECPWRKDVITGRFSKERFAILATSVKQGFFPMFACHKSSEEQPSACVGYLMNPDSENNFFVRIAQSEKKFDFKKLEAVGPLYDSFREMAAANGLELPEPAKEPWD